MKFSVIIPAYNDWKRLMKCLDALHKQSLGRDQYEVIVVDNSETGIIPSNITLPNWVHFFHEPEPGSYKARNTGARKAAGEILAFTDSDCIPHSDWLANAADCFSRSACDLLGGDVKIFQSSADNKYGYLYERITAFPQHIDVPEGRGVTANLFVKKSVFDAAGGFSSTIKSEGDWEFTVRCTDKGYKMIYCGKVLVLHPARTLVNIFNKQKRMSVGGALGVKEKYGHGYLRMLGSHLIHGPNLSRANMPKRLRRGERATIYFIDMLIYFYRTALYSGLALRLVDPNKIRE
jgi:glycosyltransferase involved in cell wall biosynthesis